MQFDSHMRHIPVSVRIDRQVQAPPAETAAFQNKRLIHSIMMAVAATPRTARSRSTPAFCRAAMCLLASVSDLPLLPGEYGSRIAASRGVAGLSPVARGADSR